MKKKREPWFWIYSGTAVVMATAIVIFLWSVLSSRREGSRVTANESRRTGGGMIAGGYEALGRFYPPAYRENSSAALPGQFKTAMQHYSHADYAAAVPDLAEVVKATPDFVPARFYLGICYLFNADRPAGIAQLRRVIAAGDTPYLAPARFYLAKGLLASGEIPEARLQLQDAIAMHGEIGEQAESLLAQLR